MGKKKEMFHTTKEKFSLNHFITETKLSIFQYFRDFEITINIYDVWAVVLFKLLIITL